MNSEELELSLRSEFESHLKTVAADMRQEFTQFQAKVEAEFNKHRSQLDAVFQDYCTQFDNNTTQLEGGFAETVIEHLRLARDEGSRVSALAFEEAERMEAENAAAAAPQAGIAELSRAIGEITAQDSQATILKSLVQNAAQFTPRGAFFIIKNEHFVGWRVFGKEGEADEQAVREVFFPVASSTALGESVRSLSAVESSYGAYSDDSIYLNKLDFGQPEKMYAIPLVARGRGVAVLYADYGTQGEEVNFEALETLVRVAGMTVEVLAAAIPKPTQDFQPASGYAEPAPEESREEYVESKSDAAEEFQPASDEQPAEKLPAESADYATQPESADSYYDSTHQVEETEEFAEVSAEEEETVEEAKSWSQPSAVEATEIVEEIEVIEAVEVIEEVEAVEAFENDSTNYQPVTSESDYSVPQANDYQFARPAVVEESPSEVEETTSETEEADSEIKETTPFESPAFEPIERFPVATGYSNGRAETAEVETFEPVAAKPAVAEPVVAKPAVAEPAVALPPVRSRFSDRNVDLPIEVSEDERRLHNDARRFARLLVSEIKLYNEQKVKEGREAQDLYERLREAIDRSRDMYDKRVQPPVAARFDYFHYELVSSLAEGEENRLGGTYPGAAS